jgi:hypothetical protein
MCADHNPDQLADAVGEATRATNPSEPAREIPGIRGAPAVADELVETEFHRGDPSYESVPQSRPQKTAPRDALPVWREIDLETVVPSPAIEAALQAEGIVRIHRPSTGIVEIGGLRRLAFVQPIHVIREEGRWVCFVHWELVEEAKRKLHSPKVFPVCVSADINSEEIRDYVLTEQITVPIRHQMSGRQLASLAPRVLALARRHSNLFVLRSREDWAKAMGRSLSWLKHLMAAKSVKNDTGDQ